MRSQFLIRIVENALGRESWFSVASTLARTFASASPDSSSAPTPRRKSIKFPPRITADGRRISDMNMAEAAAATAAAHSPATSTTSTPPPAQPPPPPPPASNAAPPPSNTYRPPPAGLPTTPNLKVIREETATMHRLPISQREMDTIDLGGASPYERKAKVAK